MPNASNLEIMARLVRYLNVGPDPGRSAEGMGFTRGRRDAEEGEEIGEEKRKGNEVGQGSLWPDAEGVEGWVS